MRLLDEQGVYPVEPADAHEAAKLARYWNAVREYLNTGDDHELRRFRDQRLRTRQNTVLPFLTDLDILDRLAGAGEVNFEELYARTA
jgi:hypothetical protein